MTTAPYRQRKYIALLAAISAGILFLGVWLKPEATPEVAPSPSESMRLTAIAQRSTLEDQAAYFSSIAAAIQPRVVWVRETGASGLTWNGDGSIVTAGPREPVSGSITAVGAPGEITLEPEVLSTSFPVAVVKAPASAGLQPVQRGSAEQMVPGMWILQISRQPGGEPLFTPGIYSGVATVRCGRNEYRAVQSSIPLTAAALGAGLFDLDANLVAVVLRCGEQFAAVLPGVIDEIWSAANSLEGRLLRLYGLRVNSMNETARAYFGAMEGVWVSETLDGMRASAAGLAPGDVIVALGGMPVTKAEDLQPVLAGQRDAVYMLEVQRRVRGVARRVTVELAGSLTAQPLTGSTGSGIGLTPPPEGFPVESVAPGSAAERAGLMPGDRLLLVNGTPPANLAAARRALSNTAGQPAFLVIQRGSRELGVFLQ